MVLLVLMAMVQLVFGCLVSAVHSKACRRLVVVDGVRHDRGHSHCEVAARVDLDPGLLLLVMIMMIVLLTGSRVEQLLASPAAVGALLARLAPSVH